MATSVIITGKHKMKQKKMYIMTNAAPPPKPTSKGNFQILPSPTAEPDAAKMKPNLLVNEPRPAMFLFKKIKRQI